MDCPSHRLPIKAREKKTEEEEEETEICEGGKRRGWHVVGIAII